MPHETLLDALRERIGLVSVKDGCAPQGQCGCCTVLVDGEPRVACVTPLARVAGRAVTTVEGLEPEARDRVAAAFVACGGSQCGFCTPGIVMRFAGTRARDVDHSLAAHLCRCTGWLTGCDRGTGRGSRARPRARVTPCHARRWRAATRRERRAAGRGAVRRRHCAAWRARRGAVATRIVGRLSRGRRNAMGRGRVTVGGASRCRKSAGPTHHAPGPATVARSHARAFAGWRAARNVVGRARVPRARRVMVCARRHAGFAARQRWRVRRQA